MREKRGGVFRNNYKGLIDKTKAEWNQGREVEMAVARRGGHMKTTVLEHQ